MKQITKDDVVQAILYNKQHLTADIKFTPELQKVLYRILYGFYVQNKKYVLLQAPTGSGKSIIGFVLGYCVDYLEDLIRDDAVKELGKTEKPGSVAYNELYDSILEQHPKQTVYYLTSSKILQQQIYNDINRFNLSNMKMLKGTNSYICIAERNNINRLLITPEEKKAKMLTANYTNRPCKNETQPLPDTKYSECFKICPYLEARRAAIESQDAVLNYHYFLTVQNSAFKLFKPRKVTICDEAHKLNEIVDDMFTCQMNVHFIIDLERVINKLHTLRYVIEDCKIYDDPSIVMDMKNKFATVQDSKQLLIQFMNVYYDTIQQAKEFLEKAEELILKERKKNPEKTSTDPVLDKITSLKETATRNCEVLEYYTDALSQREQDIFLRAELPFQAKYYVVEVKDLNESHMLQEKFLRWTDKVLFMSATMGDMTEFADTYALPHDQCCVVKMPSTFDFSTSPIYLCNVGNLRRKDFDKNIDKCLRATVAIIKEHSTEKGLVHTHTFGINKALREIALYDQDLCNRLKFYETAQDKERIIQMMKTSEEPLVICGPSLVEGIDLKYDLGRFNILIKTPYAPINDYVKAKMNYCSFWYRRMTKQTIVQSIGRTNRAKDDWSKTYLIDSGFYDLIWELDDEIITPRIQELKINIPQPRVIQQPQQYSPQQNYNVVNTNNVDDFGEGDLPF